MCLCVSVCFCVFLCLFLCCFSESFRAFLCAYLLRASLCVACFSVCLCVYRASLFVYFLCLSLCLISRISDRATEESMHIWLLIRLVTISGKEIQLAETPEKHIIQVHDWHCKLCKAGKECNHKYKAVQQLTDFTFGLHIKMTHDTKGISRYLYTSYCFCCSHELQTVAILQAHQFSSI